MASLAVLEPAGTQLWRVGYRPQPWAWAGWEWASEGRFPGRWDDTTPDGMVFQSRHDDDITLWAVFERPGDGPISPCLADITDHELHVDHPEVERAMELLGLHWHTPDASDSTG